MTEQELDRIMRRVLIDSLKADAEQRDEGQTPSFKETSRHRRQMRAMLANPMGWLRRRTHPVWRRVAQRVAIIFLICILIFGGVMAFSPTARAAVVQWVTEWYDNTIRYLYTGEQNTEELPQYDIAELPDGYVESARDVAPGLVAVTYENRNGDVIYFDYSFMHQGSQTVFVLNDDDVYDVTVNQMQGQFFESQIPGNFNSLTWIDSDKNIQFSLDGNFELEELLHIAESVYLCKAPK